MRLFRQREGRNWESVVEELTKALFERVKSALRVPIEPLHGATVRAPDGAANVTPALPLQPSPAPALSAVCESRYGIVQHFPNGPLAASLIYYGEYRQLELELIGRFLKPGSWVLQVGAGVGVDTLFLAAGVGEAGHVLAYESDPLLHQLARQNLAANRVRNVTLLRRQVGSGGAPGTEGGANGGAAGVGADSVDSLRLARLDWIKMDSPSAGERVLAGAGDALWRFRPWIFMSVDEDASLASFLQLTGDFGYRSWRVKTPLFHPTNYACRSDDIFAGQFAFGVLCIPEEIDMDVTLEGCTPCT
jgi:hypothetical protein